MNKKFLHGLAGLLFLIVIVPSTVYSQYNMNVNLKNGTTVTYTISEIEKIDFSEITAVDKGQTSLPTSFNVRQNYPNPFNAGTTIFYEIPGPGRVEIKIIDINGRVVKNIASNNQQAGVAKITWDGDNKAGSKVASGLYLYAIKYENKIIAKKMILLK